MMISSKESLRVAKPNSTHFVCYNEQDLETDRKDGGKEKKSPRNIKKSIVRKGFCLERERSFHWRVLCNLNDEF